jgi:hypothetical protein
MPSTANTQLHGLNDDEISIIIFDKGKGKRKEHLLFFTVIGALMFSYTVDLARECITERSDCAHPSQHVLFPVDRCWLSSTTSGGNTTQ